MSEKKEFYLRPLFSRYLLYMAIVIDVIVVVSLLLQKMLPFGYYVNSIVLSLLGLNYYKPILVVWPDKVIFKGNLFTKNKEVPFQQITSVKDTGRAVELLLKDDKPIKLPKWAFVKNDLDEIMKMLKVSEVV